MRRCPLGCQQPLVGGAAATTAAGCARSQGTARGRTRRGATRRPGPLQRRDVSEPCACRTLSPCFYDSGTSRAGVDLMLACCGRRATAFHDACRAAARRFMRAWIHECLRHGAAKQRRGPACADVCRRPDNQAVTSATDPIALSAKRVRRLDILVQLRKVYRNLIRAEGLLTLPTPVYRPAGAVRGPGRNSASHELRRGAVVSSRPGVDVRSLAAARSVFRELVMINRRCCKVTMLPRADEDP